MRAPLLDKEEEYRLAVAWRDKRDVAAYNKIIFCHIRLVASMARSFRGGASIDDLYQEGMIGLVEAIIRFDPDRDIRFSTYAQWWIRSYMSEYVQRSHSLVRMGASRSQKSLFFNLRRLRSIVERHGSSMPEFLPPNAVKAIAETLHAKEDEVRHMELRLSGRDSSLNTPIGEEGSSEAIDLLADDSESPEEIVMAGEKEFLRNHLIREAMSVLDDRERFIFEKRDLVDNPATLDELGSELGISKERVRQIEHKGRQKLKRWIEERIDSIDDIV